MRLAKSKKTLGEAERETNDSQEVPMKKGLAGFMLILLLIFPVSAYSGVPLETVKGSVNRVLDVLRDSAPRGEAGRKATKEKIHAISEEMFDFTELSKRSLGQNWNKMTPDQQKEFINLYRLLLEETYADKITSYTDEKLVFGKEITLSEKTVEVQTTVVTKTSEVPINYRVIEEKGHWRVYDVVIEGVSLISNYRSQFREILANKTPEALLETLRKKVGKAQAS
jgi:phospholipid transport system substrate-binding protein